MSPSAVMAAACVAVAASALCAVPDPASATPARTPAAVVGATAEVDVAPGHELGPTAPAGDAGEVAASAPSSVDPSPPAADPTPPADPATLPRPGLETILPGALPQAGQDAGQITSLAATPVQATTVGYTEPDGEAVLALDADGLGLPARWAVTDQRDDWVQVLVPFGRGALASVAAARTNQVAAWVRAADVEVTPAQAYVLDLSDRLLTGSDAVVPVAVGKDVTPTPTGLCAVVGHVYDPHVGDALLTSCQSEAMDEYQAGTGYAVIALHPDPEGGRAIGQARSNGCIRMHAQDFRALLESAQPGDLLAIVE